VSSAVIYSLSLDVLRRLRETWGGLETVQRFFASFELNCRVTHCKGVKLAPVKLHWMSNELVHEKRCSFFLVLEK
jgi:hypothetical protein